MFSLGNGFGLIFVMFIYLFILTHFLAQVSNFTIVIFPYGNKEKAVVKKSIVGGFFFFFHLYVQFFYFFLSVLFNNDPRNRNLFSITGLERAYYIIDVLITTNKNVVFGAIINVTMSIKFFFFNFFFFFFFFLI
jgi:hypothetical protein